MTNEEKRIKIAEALGLFGFEVRDGVLYGWYDVEKPGVPVPDYFYDLNAYREMIKSANFEDDTFLENLATIVSGKKCFKVSEANPWNFIEASAEQIAEAFGQTLKLW